MKKYSLLTGIALIFSASVFAQVKMGDNVDQISPHALLELESTTQGLVIPRMTSAQRDAAFDQTTPVGTVIFNTDLNKMQYLRMWKDPQANKPIAKFGKGRPTKLLRPLEGGTPTIDNPMAGDLYYDEERKHPLCLQ